MHLCYVLSTLSDTLLSSVFQCLALVRAAISICSFSQGNSCWLQALGLTLLVTVGAASRKQHPDKVRLHPGGRAEHRSCWLWGNPRDKGAVPGDCPLSESHWHVVGTKVGQGGMNLFERKGSKPEGRRDKPALLGVSGFGAGVLWCWQPSIHPGNEIN